MTFDAVMELVAKERVRQDQLWGVPEHRGIGRDVWLDALTEEAGEVAKARLADQKPWKPGHDLRTELVQVAALCGAFYQALFGKPVWDRFVHDLELRIGIGIYARCLGTRDIASHLGRVADDLTAGKRQLRGRLVFLAVYAIAWAMRIEDVEEGGVAHG